MVRKQVEIDGRKLLLGESTAGAIEECQETLADERLDTKTKLHAMRSFVVHCLSRGGTSWTAEQLAAEFSVTEFMFLYREAQAVSGLRQLPEGEVLGP